MTEKTLPNPTSLSEQDRLELEALVIELEERGLTKGAIRAVGPETDDELWDAVYDLSGWKIPRVAVCIHLKHVAPFDIFADLYFNRRTDVLWIGPRGGGKTTMSALLHSAKARWNPGFKSLIAGALMQQAKRAYSVVTRFTAKLEDEVDGEPTRSEIKFKNGSWIENVVATIKALNGPHPHLSQLDEAELVKITGGEDPFEEFLNMSQGDHLYIAQNLLTSTRKWSFGRVQAIVKECEQAEKHGNDAPWDVCIFCVFEIMQNQPGCGTTCGCDKIVKGQKEVDNPETGEKEFVDRTFADVCNGRAKLSDGYMRIEDVHRRFKQLKKSVWEAQMECIKPNPEGLVHGWLHEGFMLGKWFPEPEYGPIFCSWDWGGTNPHAVLFHQYLKTPVTLTEKSISGEFTSSITLDEGTIVTFDEIYGNKDEIGGITRLAKAVIKRKKEWHKHGFPIEFSNHPCDPAGSSARKDVEDAFVAAGEPRPNWWMRKAPRVDSLQKHVEFGEDGLLYIVKNMCPNLLDEMNGYHHKRNTDGTWSEDAVDFDDHACDSYRYMIWNLWRWIRNKPPGEGPGSKRRGESDKPVRNGKIGPGGVNDSYVTEAPSSTISKRHVRTQRFGSTRT